MDREQNRTILTSQSISEGGDYEVVYRELHRVRARVIVLLCQASEGGRFLRGAYQAVPRVGGEGFLFFGSDAVASSGTWQKDNAAGGLSSDVELRQQVMKGFFGITASFGQGTPAYESYRSRLVAYSNRSLPGLAVGGVLRTDEACDAASAGVLDGPASVWNATDADGRRDRVLTRACAAPRWRHAACGGCLGCPAMCSQASAQSGGRTVYL